MRSNEEYRLMKRRCRDTLYLRRHKVTQVPGRGYRCKYCDRMLSDLRYEDERRRK